MLNYLWAGMILISIIFSIGNDISDEINNKYSNQFVYTFSYTASSQPDVFSFVAGNEIVHFSSKVSNNSDLVIPVSHSLPKLWQEISEQQSSANKKELRVEVVSIDNVSKKIKIQLPEVHWVKVRSVTKAAFDMAEFAVKLAIGLAGIMALWLGLMRIAEKSGLISYFVKLIYPLLHWLFPKIDKNHPVLGSISLNMAANVLGLGNAATPMGIKAMQQLQQLNKCKDSASDEMCMFLAINTSSVQLLPPVTLIALMGIGVSELIVPIILATSASTIVAVISAKTFARMRQQ